MAGSGAWKTRSSRDAGGMPVTEAALKPCGFARFTSLGSAVDLTSPASGTALATAIAAGARIAILVCETQAIRWRDDGSNPTAAIGMPLPVNTIFTYTGDLSALKVIEQTASASLNVAYYA